MQEITLEEQMRAQMHIQEPVTVLGQQTQQQPNRQNRPKRVKKQPQLKAEATIEETINSLKNEIEYMPMKTPISILQELLSRRGITPNYELVQIEGAVHEPSFRYRVSFNDKDAMGVGRSKKEAKHAAAKALIDKLTGLNLSDTFYQQQKSFASNGSGGALNTSSSSTNFDEKNQMGNPIGVLQEFCMSKHWPPPQYEVEVEVGLPHERQFTIGCLVLKFREVGMGKSKKIAKRQAAQKMWERLQSQPMDQADVVQSCIDDANDEMRIANILSRYSELKEANIPTLTNQHSFKVSQFHKVLKNTYGKSLAKLQNMCLNNKDVNYVAFLQEIANEHKFEVTYVDIEEKTYSGRSQCLVQLSTLPVAVCQGSGQTSKDANKDAAKNALEYLKIMTKKQVKWWAISPYIYVVKKPHAEILMCCLLIPTTVLMYKET
ncbi:CLUMA_CG015794, isoform A [Clunio marinus]|uniref:CLUMA_CG015794, isoform A n=1 Tax=Clunio marinus TaxID=568069 RepID=A0A1J1IVW3_9DIPT|nr:CLUMA_CG015794, isoform A [Clunio marinus]